MEKSKFNRRKFIKTTSASVALSLLGSPLLAIDDKKKSLKVGLIGTGWYGKNDLFRLLQVADIDVVALCDVDENKLSEAADLVKTRQNSSKKPKTYSDYREMLSARKLDIVIVNTPDHWHALQAIAAIKSGAHVYLQKPVSVDVLEGEAILACARKYNKVVQVGTQRKSTPHLIEVKKEVIDKGLLGKISHVEMCCYYHMRANKNPSVQDIPDFLDYEMWTGPAPMRAYDGIPHRGWWRAFMEYSNGIMGDMCVHMLDTTRWMLGLGWPNKISSTGGIYVQKESKANTSDTQTAVFEFDELNCVWQHRSWGTAPDPEYPWAFFIYGEKGVLKASVHKAEFIPIEEGEPMQWNALYEKEKYPEDVTEKDIELHAAPATRNHMIDFLTAIRNNTKPVSDIEDGHISTASCIIANLAMKLGRPLVYNPITKKFNNDPEADKLLKRAYRGEWEHPWEGK